MVGTTSTRMTWRALRLPQQYLPKRLLGTYFYKPSGEGYEAQVSARLQMWRDAQRKALGIESTVEVPGPG